MEQPRQPDPFIEKFFSRIPDEVAESFTKPQLGAVKMAFGKSNWNQHTIDYRRTMALLGKRFYFVLIAGEEKRSDRRLSREYHVSAFKNFTDAIMVIALILLFSATIFGVVYGAKRALDINTIPQVDMLPDKQLEGFLSQ